MSYLYDLEPKHYPALLSGELAQIPDLETPPTPGNIPFNTDKRTILIGLGGTGVKIIDAIKGEMRKRFIPGWEHHISFLAVDTDDWDLRDARNLTREECVRAARPGISNAVHMGYGAYPKAWRRFVDEDQAHNVAGGFHPGWGTSRRRLIGRMKLHYKSPGDRGVDEEIVDKLREQKCNVLLPITPYPADHYDVYVIGSLCGGTGSGMMTDFPALIRHALGPHSQVMIHAMVTLPDTMAALDPANADELNASGYAALKELEYYQQLPNRREYPEVFPYNDPAVDALQIPGGESPFATVTLLGSPNGPTSDAAKIARETAVGTILARLESYPAPQFGVNFSTRQDGILNHWAAIHPAEPFRAPYGAVGCARTEVPQELLRAYAVGQLCKKAGILPVSENEYMAMLAGGQTPLPFRSEHHYDSAHNVTTQARQLLQPLIQFMQTYQKPDFSYEKVFATKPTWEEIRSGQANDPSVQMRTQHEIARLTGCEEVHRLEDEVKGLFHQFRQAVMQYVEEFGPFAFVNLFRGNGISGPAGEQAVGIRELLCLLRDDMRPDTRTPILWPVPEDMEAELGQITREIQSAPGGVMAMMHRAMGRHEEMAARWVQAYDNLVNARVNEVRRKMMLFSNGILNRYFLEPAMELAQQLYSFGKVLETMSEIYRNHGMALTQPGAAQNAPLCVNIAGLFSGIPDGIRRELDRFVDSHNPWHIRQTLVQDFFQNPDQWLELDDNNLERRGGGSCLCLRDPWKPIAARIRFDRLLKQQMAPVPEFTLDQLFRFAAAQGITAQQFAHALLTGLTRRSTLRLNAHLGNCGSMDLTYPNDLHQSNPALLAALQQEVAQNFHNINLFPSHDAQGLGLYETGYGFAITELADLPRWEQDYEAHLTMMGNGLHGMSPDVQAVIDDRGHTRYEEKTPWADYPGLVRRLNPMVPDPVTGEICRDGQMMHRVMEPLKAAREAGVLRWRPFDDTLYVERVCLDDSIQWQFDAGRLEPDSETGLLPTGQNLLKQICIQNGVEFHNVNRGTPVWIDCDRYHQIGEWASLCEALFFHRPILCELRDTLERIEPWIQEVERRNRK